MPFPFLPGGALLAVAILAGVFTLFGLALRAMDRAFAASRESMLPGLVSGIRRWAPPMTRTTDPVEPATDIDPVEPATDAEIIELIDRRIPVERRVD